MRIAPDPVVPCPDALLLRVYAREPISCALHRLTNDLPRRVSQHKRADPAGHTTRYRITMLVYFETFEDAGTAIRREKQMKRWPRVRKARLIERHNPDWRDLSRDWPGTDL